MKHARKDYNRFQEPIELLTMIRRLASYCRAGEQLNEDDELDLEVLMRKYRPENMRTPIGEDEPVFLLRAKDALFSNTLMCYYEQLMDHPDGEMRESMRKLIWDHIQLTDKWLETHNTKAPDVP